MTTIRITALDRQLILLDRMTVASGDTNTVRVQISTDASWEGYLCEAVFFREGDRDLVLTAPLDHDGACAVPAQLLTDPCTLYIGLRGQRESMTATGELTQRKTSALVSYRVVEGIPAEAGTALVNPTAATADEESVLAGKTFYAGDQSTIRTGTIRTYEEGTPVLLMPYVESDPNVPAWAKKPNPPTPAEIGAAPAGLGLGVQTFTLPILSNANDAKSNGWYRLESSTQNGVGTSATLRVECFSVNSVLQTAYDFYGEKKVRRFTSGAWGEWEWVNPPMQLGVEYRTTERYQGKAVYTKLVNCGNAPNAGTKQVEWNSFVTGIVRMTAVTASSYALPFEAFSIRMEAWCSGQHIWIKTTGDFSQHTVYAQFWYTK